jgi:uncharacterized protein (TIGR04222 family)
MYGIFAPMLAISGPVFLVVYALVAVAIVVLARARIAAADPSAARTMMPAPVDVERDPSEIAYLRGGGNELLRFTIFDLIRRGDLALADTSDKKRDKLIVATGHAEDAPLTSLQREVLAFFITPHSSKEIFASDLPDAAATFGAAQYEPRLQREGMFPSPGVDAARKAARMFGYLVLLSLGAYRIAYALVMHHSFGFLVVEVLIAVVLLTITTHASRLSDYGRSYLKRLATAVRPRQVAPIAAGLGMLPIAVAATGFAALAGTEYAPLNTVFRQAATSDSGGCGSSCSSGSSDGGGGGCGGGCGG